MTSGETNPDRAIGRGGKLQGELAIRPAHAEDVASIVQVHVQSFPDFFLTFLGPKFLEVLYRRTIEQPDSINYVALSGRGQVIGFVIGVTSQGRFYSRLIRNHLMEFGWASLGAALRRPAIIPRLLRALRRPGEAQARAADCLLMSLAVHPAAQGSGAGSSLVRSFLKEAERRGARAVSLTTDRAGNEGVNRFYESLGFTRAQSYTTAEGRPMNEYIAVLPPAQVP